VNRQRNIDLNQLPDWFGRPQPSWPGQSTLFAQPLGVVLAKFQVSLDELHRWNEAGWISLGTDTAFDLEPWHEYEIEFVRDIVRSGLPDAAISHLFGLLPRPMSFDPRLTAYSFTFGWVSVIPHPDPSEVIEEGLDSWIIGLVDSGEVEELERIETVVAGAIKRAKSILSEDEESPDQN
jgi:hypothetical protein